MSTKIIRVFQEFTSEGYIPFPVSGNIDYGVTVGNTFPSTTPPTFQTDNPDISVTLTATTDYYVWVRSNGTDWNPMFTRSVRVYPDSALVNNVTMGIIIANLSGVVPYSGAISNVNLGTNSITASSFIKSGGTISQYLMADGSVSSGYSLPTASTTILGGVKVDGTTITINGAGVISGANTYVLPTATDSILGGVKIGSGVSINSGVISVSTNYQLPLGGTGFVKSTAGVISYDTNTYLTTTDAISTYQRKDKMVSNLLASDTEYPNSNAVLAKLALKADSANPQFTGSMNIVGIESRINFYDENNAIKYFIGYDSGFLRIYQNASSSSKLYISSSGKTFIPGDLEVGTINKSGGTASQFLMANGSVSTNPGWITGITSANVISALGYTPYNGAINPNGYVTSTGSVYFATLAGGVAWTGVTGRPTALSQFSNDLGNYGGWITSSGRAYPRRSDGNDINFYWSGQGGQPPWLWGSSDGTNMYVYNPSNFSVNYANSAGSAGSVAWTNVSGRPTNVSSFSNDSGYVTASGSVAFASSAGSVAWVNVSGRPTALSAFSNDQGYITSSSLSGYLPLTGGTLSGVLSATAFYETSDKNIKELIKDNYQVEGIEKATAKLYMKNGREEIGYFAQDFEDIMPNSVLKSDFGLLNLSYREVHTAKIARLEKELEELKAKIK